MDTKKQTLVGTVESVNGSTISVKISNSLLSNMPIIDGIVYRTGQIGAFLKIPLGYAYLYGIITQVGASAIPESLRLHAEHGEIELESNRWLSMVLIGEQVGIRFERGITQYPTTGDQVHIVTIHDLKVIYGQLKGNNAIRVGNISASESLDALLDLDKVVSRHCAIVGSTGSGKSNAVAILLEAIAQKNFSSSRILVIDPHGEYNETFPTLSKVFKVNADCSKGETELYVPYWALRSSELLQIFPGSLTDQQSDYVLSKIQSMKKEYCTANQALGFNAETVTVDSPIPFSINKLWFELDDFERITYKKDRVEIEDILVAGDPEELRSNEYPAAGTGSAAPFLNPKVKGILRYLDGVKNRILDRRYHFLFQPGPYSANLTGSVEKDLSCLLEDWVGHDKPITILDLSGIPSEIMASVAGTVLSIVYDALFWGQETPAGGREQPILFVLEEAHNYIKNSDDSIASRTLQTIAKEGRKYGAGLLLVSQRPSELDETVLSQCGTLISLRLNNARDRAHISSAIQDELQVMVDLLPSLRTGEAIITGEAVKIPSRVKFNQIAHAPKSSDPAVSEKWTKERPSSNTYLNVVKKWCNQTLQ